MQKHIKKAQLIVLMLIFTLIAMGTVSAADNLSDKSVTCVNHTTLTQNTQHITNVVKINKNLSINKTKTSNTSKDPQIWHDGVPVSRGGHPAGYNWGTIQNAVNNALSGDTIMLENGCTFSGEGNTQITLSKNLNFDVLYGGRAIIDGHGIRWGFVVNPGFKASFNNIIFQNMFKPSNGAALENNRGTLTLNHCVFVNSQAVKDGGVIYNNGSLYMNRCLVNNNLGGSGIYTAGSGKVDIRNSSIFNNINEDGIGITVESGNPNITGNNIYGNFWRGIYIMGGNAVISNNNIHNNGHGTHNGDGIWINGGNPVITSNNIRNNSEDGIHIDRSSKDNSKTNKLNIHYNSIVDNGKCGLHVVNHVYVNAIHNWWGTNSPMYVRQIFDPSYPKDIFEQYDNPSINHISWNPYLYLRINSNSPIYNGHNSTVTAYFTRDNRKDSKINLAPGTVPDGTTVTFRLTNGTYGRLTEPFTRTTVGGVATIVFTANNPNTQNVSATVDHQQVTTEIDIKPQARVVMSLKSNSPAHVGGIGQFIVTLTNYGPDIAYKIIVQEHNLLPDFIHEMSDGWYDEVW